MHKVEAIVDHDQGWAFVYWGFVGLTTVLFLFLYFPPIVCLFGGLRYENGGTEDPHAVEQAADPVIAPTFNELQRIGFAALGMGWMRLWFAGERWCWRETVAAFSNGARQSFAFCRYLPPPYDCWLRATFVTCFADGGMLLTTSGESEQTTETSQGCTYVTVASMDVVEVEAHHRRTAEAARAAGRPPEPDLRLQTLLDYTCRSGSRNFRKEYKPIARAWLLSTSMYVPVLLVAAAACICYSLALPRECFVVFASSAALAAWCWCSDSRARAARQYRMWANSSQA